MSLFLTNLVHNPFHKLRDPTAMDPHSPEVIYHELLQVFTPPPPSDVPGVHVLPPEPSTPESS